MSNLAQRLEKALSHSPGKTQAGLARACGIKPPSVSDWLHGKTKSVEGSNLIKASEYLGVRSKWLATGLGPMLPTPYSEPSEAKEDAKIYEINQWPFKTIDASTWQKLTAQQKTAVESVIHSFAGSTTKQTAKHKAN